MSEQKCWNKNGWIKGDIYGFVEWYINYYYGRRSDDDEYQIKRWLGFKKRFGNQRAGVVGDMDFGQML